MVRVVVVAFHLLLCATLYAELSTTLLQLRVDSLWEEHFYGAWSATSSGLGALIGLDLLITAIHSLFVLSYAAGRKQSTTRLLGGSALLVGVVTPPARWALAGVAGLVLADEFRRRLPEWAEQFANRDDNE